MDLEEAIEKIDPPQENREEAVDYKDKYLRMLAEIENSRKRMQKEKQESVRFAKERLLIEIIKPIDQFENALSHSDKTSHEINQWALGFRMILEQFKEILTEHGISSFHSEGKLFNPEEHEAVEMEENSSLPEGTVIKEFDKGYRCGNRIIRPARVKVAKKIIGEANDE